VTLPQFLLYTLPFPILIPIFSLLRAKRRGGKPDHVVEWLVVVAAAVAIGRAVAAFLWPAIPVAVVGLVLITPLVVFAAALAIHRGRRSGRWSRPRCRRGRDGSPGI